MSFACLQSPHVTGEGGLPNGQETGLAWTIRTLHTPEGSLTEERYYEPTFGTTAATAHFIKEPDDYKVFLAYLRDMQVIKEPGIFTFADEYVGDDGLPHTDVVRTPFQQLWVEWVNIQDLAWHLVECEALMDEVVAVMTAVQRRIFEVTCETVAELAGTDAAIPYIDVPDNITAPAIGKTYFDAYCVPAYDELAGQNNTSEEPESEDQNG